MTHELAAFYDKDSKVLIFRDASHLRSRGSRDFITVIRRNRFWKVLALLLGEEFPQTVEERKRFLKRHHMLCGMCWQAVR